MLEIILYATYSLILVYAFELDMNHSLLDELSIEKDDKIIQLCISRVEEVVNTKNNHELMIKDLVLIDEQVIGE